MPDRWERYGIDPAEITPSVDVAVVGNAVAWGCVEDASAALLRTLRERATPSMRSSTKAQQGGVRRSCRCHFLECRLTIRGKVQQRIELEQDDISCR